MAQNTGKDRAAIKSDIALCRKRIESELSGLRYELDFPRKLKESFRHYPVIWIGESAVVGVLIAVAPARTKTIHLRSDKEKKLGKAGKGEAFLESAALINVAKFIATLLRPSIIKFITVKMRGHTGQAKARREV